MTVSWSRGSFLVGVTATRRKTGLSAETEKKSRQKKYTIRLTELYLKLRAKQIDLADWQEKVRECVEELAVLDRKSIVPKLFSAQLLLTETICRKCWIFPEGRQRYSFMQIQTRSVLPVRIMKKDAVLPFQLVEAYDNAVLELCGLENGQIMEFDDFTDVVQRKSWHQERGKKSVGIVSGTPSVKVRRADGRNDKKNRVTE